MTGCAITVCRIILAVMSAAGAGMAVLFVVSCAPPQAMTALVRMIPDQESYFKETVIPEFDEKNSAVVTVAHYDDLDSLESYMQRDASSIGLVKVPFDKRSALLQKGLFRSLDGFLSKEELEKFKNDYLLTDLGSINGKPCLIPRKFETRIMVFSKKRVREAVGSWDKNRPGLDAELKLVNGHGLPANYSLESDPSDWDYYDFFVAGWVWAHTSYDSVKCGRIGLRGKRYSGTWLGVVDRIFQLNGDSANVVSMVGDPVVDAFQWEALYAAAGVYNPKMWAQGWSGTDIWQAFADGEVFLSFMTQLDCFFLHGTGRDNLNGYFKNPDDMGVARMPQGCSVVLGPAKEPARTGKRSVTTGGWWWGIPTSTPSPVLAYKLVSFITSTSSQIQECSRFGMIPVRKDVLSDIGMMFGGGWIAEIYEVSFKQLVENGYTSLPAHPQLGTIGAIYLDAWYDIVANKNWSSDKLVPNREYIRELITKVYAANAAEVIGNAR